MASLEPGQSPLAIDIARLARERWGDAKPTILVGRDERLLHALDLAVRLAASDAPVLLTGETGTGKELFARALYLMSARRNKPFLAVNCAQYQDGQLIASALFGHKRGSFTGAIADQRGVFEEGGGGVIFLDEVGELSASAQAMLLRVLSEGDIIPIGATHARHVDVRVIAATSRDLRALTAAGTFRPDLYYRLRHLHVHVPALRERGDDWQLLVDHFLSSLSARTTTSKTFSSDARRAMARYSWPGNVRELRSVVDMAYHLADGITIEWSQGSVLEDLEVRTRDAQLRTIPVAPIVSSEAALALDRMTREGASFWDAVHAPYMERDLSRGDVRAIVAEGLARSGGRYTRLLARFNVAHEDYTRFMDFLRHQRLKPEP